MKKDFLAVDDELILWCLEQKTSIATPAYPEIFGPPIQGSS